MIKRVIFIWALILFGLSVIPGSVAFGAVEYPVIITFASAPLPSSLGSDRATKRRNQILGLKQHANRSQAPVLKLLQRKGAKKIRSLWINNSIAATVSPELLAELSQVPEIKSITPDRVIQLQAPVPTLLGTPSSNLDLIEAPMLWNLGHIGAGVVVATMDTGVDIFQKAVASSFRGGAHSWLDPSGTNSTAPIDADGHGTQVMSLIVSGNINVNGTPTAIGVAPGATWIAVKIFNNVGDATSTTIHLGYQWLLDPDKNENTDDAPDVVNNSWGYSDVAGSCNTEFSLDIARLRAADIAVVAASGNTGPGTHTSLSPGNYQEVLSVGSIGQNLILSTFSGQGPSACDGSIYPKFVAPGENILVADLTGGGNFPEASAIGTGTSYSAPHVAGAIALLRGAFPQASVLDIETALAATAQDLGPVGPDQAYGQGLIKVHAAYNALVAVFGTPPNPCATDTDGDGFFDCVDACPVDPLKNILGQCGCGVSDTDSDSDGVANCVDACPTNPARIALPCSVTPPPSNPPPANNPPNNSSGGGCEQMDAQNNYNGSNLLTFAMLSLAILYFRAKRNKSRSPARLYTTVKLE